MPFVLDSSVALAWIFDDEQSEYAVAILRQLREDAATVPSIWPLEIANGLIAAERRGRLPPIMVARTRIVTLDLDITIRESSLQTALGSILELGRSQRLTAYDTAYLDLAMREGLPLATQDTELRAAAERVGVPLA